MVKASSAAVRSSAAADSPYRNNNTNEVKFKGVRKRKWGKYVSEIRLPNSRERIWLGSYDAAEKAARAFDAALYCLRGSRASFNFPADPPEIDGGELLSPAGIQAVANHYANSYNGGDERVQQGEELSGAEELDWGGPIDWSFLEPLESSGNDAVWDYGDFQDMSMDVLTHFGHNSYSRSNDTCDEAPENDQPYLLWNF